MWYYNIQNPILIYCDKIFVKAMAQKAMSFALKLILRDSVHDNF